MDNEEEIKSLTNSTVVDTLRCKRNKWYLYVYHQERLNWLEKLAWVSGRLNDSVMGALNKEEIEYF